MQKLLYHRTNNNSITKYEITVDEVEAEVPEVGNS